MTIHKDAPRIFYVEDEAFVAMEFRLALEDLGYEVLGPYASIASAMAALEHVEPTAAILDFNVNGDRATPIAHALATREVPFILLSGYSKKSFETDGLSDRPILEKPVSAQELDRVLKSLLNAAG